MENQELTITKVVSATVQMSNQEVTARKYDITSDVAIEGKRLGQIQNGQVKTKGTDEVVASFGIWSENPNVSYNKTMDQDDMCEVLRAIMGYKDLATKKIQNGAAAELFNI